MWPPVDDIPSAPRRRLETYVPVGGGMGHADSRDHEPELEICHDCALPADIGKADVLFGKVGQLRKSRCPFKVPGQSGLRVSELSPRVAAVADKMTAINSMVAESANQIPAISRTNTG